MRVLFITMICAGIAAASALSAQSGSGDKPEPEPGQALSNLFEDARTGTGDPHLPFVLNRLKKALSDHDVIEFLDLVDPNYFQTQFGALSANGRSPGTALGQFSCELLSVCDISKSYGFNDIISMQVVNAKPMAQPQNTFADHDESASTDHPVPGSNLVSIALEIRMWDGVAIRSTIFYDSSIAKIFGAFG
jgi:hypothetical protein